MDIVQKGEKTKIKQQQQQTTYHPRYHTGCNKKQPLVFVHLSETLFLSRFTCYISFTIQCVETTYGLAEF